MAPLRLIDTTTDDVARHLADHLSDQMEETGAERHND